jgi:hypothetical protein
MATFSQNTDLVAVASEVTAGTGIALANLVADVSFTSSELGVEPASERQKYATGDHGSSVSVSGAIPATFKASSPLSFSGSYALAPSNFVFAKACGHALVEYRRAISGVTASGQKVVAIAGTVTGKFTVGQIVTLKEGSNTENCEVAIVGTTDLTMVENLVNAYTGAGFLYTGQALQPVKSADKSAVTVARYLVETGASAPVSVAVRAGGLVGTLDIVGDGIGKPIMLNVDMQGKYIDNTDVANADIPEYSGVNVSAPDSLLGSALTIGGTAVDVSKFGLSANNSVTRIEKVSDASGYLCGLIEKREPVFTCDPIRNTVATDDAINDAIDALTGEIVLTTAHFQIRVPKAQTVSPKQAQRNGLHSWEKTFECQRNCTEVGNVAVDTVLPIECAYEIIMGKRC